MRKTLVGIIAAGIIVGTGAYFGSKLWAQLQAKSEIEAVFDSLRGTFATVTHGKVEFDAAGRTIKIPDIVLQSNDQKTTLKFEHITSYGASSPSSDRFAAERIEIVNIQISATLPTAVPAQISYKTPKLVIENYNGPATLPRKPEATTMAEVATSLLEFVAASTADSLTIPTLTASFTPPRANDSATAMGPIEYNYSNIVFRELRNRRIAEIAMDRVTVTSELPSPELGSFAAAMARFSIIDINLDAPITILHPEKAKGDDFVSIYRSATVGPFEARFSKGMAMQIDGFSVEGVAFKPSKFSYATIIAIADAAPPPGTPPSPEKGRAMMEQVANIYEGFRLDKMEMRGFKIDVPQGGAVKIGAFRLSGFENGRLAELAIEGVDGAMSQQEPVRIGRFAFKGLHMSRAIRQSLSMADNMGRKPSLEQSLEYLSMLEGIELRDVTGSNALTKQPVRIENFNLSWGQFVGPIPTNFRFTAKTTIPSHLADQGMGMLADAGLPTITTSLDFGVNWSEAAQTLSLAPADIELDKAFAFAAKLSILNVARGMFSLDLPQAMASANVAEIGPLEITVRDNGAITTALAAYAKDKGISPEDARKVITDSIMEAAKQQAQTFPDAMVGAQALVQFVETPGSTIRIKVTPKERLTLQQAFGASMGDPAAAAGMFKVEAETTK